MDIRVKYNDGTENQYPTMRDAEDAILEAHAEGVGVEVVTNSEETICFSCLWAVKLQNEGKL